MPRSLTKTQLTRFRQLLIEDLASTSASGQVLAANVEAWLAEGVNSARSASGLEPDTVVVEREMNARLSEANASSLESIRRALGRIEDGTYGLCERCGQMIPLERLELRPRSTTCVPCSK